MENGKETGAAAEYRARRDSFDALIGVGENFDIVRKTLLVGGVRKGVYYYLNAFGNGEITEKLMEYLVSGSAGRALEDQPENFIQYFPYAEASHGEDEGQAQYLLMSGNAVLIIEGIPGYIIIDTRKYPSRGMQEPEKDKVLRGSRDGFVEALVPNVGLLRRRIRDPRLTVRKITVGKRTMTDIAVCYLKGLAREETVREVSARIESLTVAGLNMGQESLAEVLVDGYWNPFPKIRYTERPDSASAMLMEGSVIVLCDNYPAAMILPTSIFDFLQDTDDFYFPPLIGGYLKAVRTATYLLSLFLTPVWYLLLKNPGWIPPAFRFHKAHRSAHRAAAFSAASFGILYRRLEAGVAEYPRFADELAFCDRRSSHRAISPSTWDGFRRRRSCIWRLWRSPISPSRAMNSAMPLSSPGSSPLFSSVFSISGVCSPDSF